MIPSRSSTQQIRPSGFGYRPRVLLICGSLNQTTMMHRVGQQLADCDCRYTPYYCDGFLEWLNRSGLLDFTIIGATGRFRALSDEYFRRHRLPIDERGEGLDYDLVVTCSDLIVQRNIRSRPVVLVQEGMTDPEGWTYQLVRKLRLPRWLASTATTGLSLAYRRFCVASEGYRDFFAAKGIAWERLAVTGIPNFDNCAQFLDNDFPHRGYVLVATSDTRETFKRDDRGKLFDQVERLAGGRRLIFKLHPNENATRSTAEIEARFPQAIVFASGRVEPMIANCDVLITQYSTVVYVGLALGKECYSYFDLTQLRRLVPWQNGGQSAANIADVCRSVIFDERQLRAQVS
jgi:hypothetical protein